MSASEILIVGGPHNGTRLMVEDSLDHLIMHVKRPPVELAPEDGLQHDDFVYCRIPFAVKNRRYDLFCPRGIGPDAAIQMLWDGYKP